jgi:hypothetical protein
LYFFVRNREQRSHNFVEFVGFGITHCRYGLQIKGL